MHILMIPDLNGCYVDCGVSGQWTKLPSPGKQSLFFGSEMNEHVIVICMMKFDLFSLFAFLHVMGSCMGSKWS